MEQHIRESINDLLLAEAGKRYDVSLENLQYHGGFENFVYIYKKNDIEYILRLVHSDHKKYDEVLGEIEFIDYLAHHGASVSTVVHSHYDNIVEKVFINEIDYFTVAAFTRGLGERVRERANEPEIWVNLGEQLGKFHHLTKDFKPKHKRPEWYEDILFSTLPEKVLSSEDHEILVKFRQLLDKINTFPKHKDNYGLIHTDAHFGNMVIDANNHLTIFDFDDATYKHMISDIAIIIFYQFAYQNPDISLKNEKSIWILNHFLKGYLKYNKLAKEEFLRLHDFIKLRVFALYVVIIAGGPEVSGSPWGSNYLNIYRSKILNDEPIIDLEYVLNNVDYLKALA